MTLKLAIVVEDDPGVGGVYVEALKQAGFATELFTNGRAALARLAYAVGQHQCTSPPPASLPRGGRRGGAEATDSEKAPRPRLSLEVD